MKNKKQVKKTIKKTIKKTNIKLTPKKRSELEQYIELKPSEKKILEKRMKDMEEGRFLTLEELKQRINNKKK